MQLENLKRAREQSAQIALPISDQELIERYEAVFTAAVNDVLREMGYLYQTLPSAIQGLTMDMRVAGIAFTIKGSKNLRIEDEMPERAKMLDAIAPYSVCVWDTSGDDESAQWGEIMTMASMSRGAGARLWMAACAMWIASSSWASPYSRATARPMACWVVSA